MKDTGINSFSGKPRWDWSKPESSKKTHKEHEHLKAAKSKALHKAAYAGTGRRLTKEESAEKTKNWPKVGKSSSSWPETDKEKRSYQDRFKRASND